MERERIAFLVYVDLDPVPGTFNTVGSAHAAITGVLNNAIPHYNPEVEIVSTPTNTDSDHLEG